MLFNCLNYFQVNIINLFYCVIFGYTVLWNWRPIDSCIMMFFRFYIGLSTKVKKTAGQPSSHERPSSQYATIWMGAESGVYVSFSVLFIFYIYMYL